MRCEGNTSCGNEGWNWAAGDPYNMVINFVDDNNLIGKKLKDSINVVGPSNPTLTMAALTFRTSDHIAKELKKKQSDHTITGIAR